MRVFIAIFLLANVGLIWIQTIFITRVPWWKKPSLIQMTIQSIVLVWIASFTLSAFRGNRMSYRILKTTGLLWCSFTCAYLTWAPSFWVGLFFIVLLTTWIFGVLLLQNRLDRSYLNSKVQWYEGSPKAVPGLTCWFKYSVGTEPESREKLLVSNFDQEGVFVFRKLRDGFLKRLKLELQKKQIIEFDLEFADQVVSCKGIPQRRVGFSDGIGLKFKGMQLDEKKRLGDFLETIRGWGYES